MDEGAIEEFEKWSDNENEVVSSTSTSEEVALVPVIWTRFREIAFYQPRIFRVTHSSLLLCIQM